MARIVFWVQHLWGAGHVTRALAISGALARSGHEVALTLGGGPTGFPMPGGVHSVQLPPVRSADETYAQLVNMDGDPADAPYLESRRERLLAVYDEIRPDLILIEHFPFGRRKLKDELLALIGRARRDRRRPLVVSSVRDICEHPGSAAKCDQQLEWTRTLFDRVLVHSDPALIRLEDSLPHTRQLAKQLVYTGFVVRPSVGHRSGGSDDIILVVPGSGRGGGTLLDRALDALEHGIAPDRPWHLVAGPLLEPDVLSGVQQRVKTLRRPDLVLETQRPDLQSLMATARLIVSQCGYGMAWESLSLGQRFVAVPAAISGEQRLRAEILARENMAWSVLENIPSAGGLSSAMEKALNAPSLDVGHVRFNGAETTARLLTRALQTEGGEWAGF